jgi:hypothetical protein
MRNHTPNRGRDQVRVHVTDTVAIQTQYAGLCTVYDVWQRLGVAQILDGAGIHYGDQGDDAEEFSFVLTVAPFIRAPSVTKAAQRFGGEPSLHGQEADALLEQLLLHSPSQRQLSRFTATERYDWGRFQEQLLQQLWRVPAFAPQRNGVVIIDDWPLCKPYAECMPYLSPIWDSNLKRKAPGYQVVHLYYDYPGPGGYSLYVEPWLKTSQTGQTQPKPRSRARRAREGEERSKLDIALDALEHYLPLVRDYEAVLMDNWYTARWFCAALTEMGVPWIGEAGESCKFQVGGRNLWVKEIFQFYRSRKRRLKGFGRRVQAVAIPAIWLRNRSTPIDQPVLLVLVTGLPRSRPNDKGYKLLVCNQLHWTAKRVVRLFSRRPHIEQAHRQGKQHAGWKDFHARSLQALLCHLALCVLRMDLLHLCRLWYPISATYSLPQVIDHLLRYVALLTMVPFTGQVWLDIPSQHPALGFWT